MIAPRPPDDNLRVQALRERGIFGSRPQVQFDELAATAAQTLQMPVAMLNLLDADKQWTQARTGIDLIECDRERSLCSHAVLEPRTVTVVPDLRADERFSDNPLVTGEPHLRFYAAAPLRTTEGRAIGTLCVADVVPRAFGDAEARTLQALANEAMRRIDARAARRFNRATLEARADRLKLLEAAMRGSLDGILICETVPGGARLRITHLNEAFTQVTGYTAEDLNGRRLLPLFGRGTDRDVLRWMAGAVEARRPFNAEVLCYRMDRTEVWFELSVSPIAQRGAADAWVAVTRDVTERKRRELLEAERSTILHLTASDAPLPRVLERIAQAVETMFPQRRGAVSLLHGAVLTVAAGSRSLPVSLAANLPRDAEAGIRGAALDSGHLVVAADVARDVVDEATRAVLVNAGLAAAWSLPIVSSRDNVVGTLDVYASASAAITADERRVLGELARLAGMAVERYEDHVSLLHLALHDPVTDLPNRALFEEGVVRAIDGVRATGRTFALGVIDIDRFKVVNDEFGHAAGDRVLREISRRLVTVLRGTDTVARLGGDEFLIMIEGVSDRAATEIIAQRVLDALTPPYMIGEREITLTARIGLASYPEDGAEPSRLLSLADSAVAAAKTDDLTIAFFKAKRRRPLRAVLK